MQFDARSRLATHAGGVLEGTDKVQLHMQPDQMHVHQDLTQNLLAARKHAPGLQGHHTLDCNNIHAQTRTTGQAYTDSLFLWKLP